MTKSTLRVLLIDDQPEFLYVATGFLRSRKDVEIAGRFTSGRQAVEAAAELQPDVVLVDLIMPEMNGFQVTRQLRASGSSAYIVILSAYDTDGYSEAAADAGADRFTSKIRLIEDFTSLLDELLRGAM